MNRCLTLLLISLITMSLHAQSGSVSGFVYDQSNGEGLIGVNVFIPELNTGGATNTSGYYIIPGIAAGSYTLVSDYIGYRISTQRIGIRPGQRLVLDINLAPELLEGETVEVFADSVRTVIRLYEKPISNIQLNTRQINAIPQVAEADLLRSLQTLPGILPVSDFSSALYVRGGTPDQNLYLLDGTDVYNPEHAFGIFSTFNTDAIKHVDISKGGFNATYGGRLSSILDVTNNDGNRESFEGKASISLLSAKTTVQMPIGTIGAISGSIRRTYFDKTAANFIDDIPNYYFYDGNIKAYMELDPRNKITVSGYGGRDVLNLLFNNASSSGAGFDLDWGNRTGSIRWTRVFNPQLFANFWVTGSRFSSNFDLGEAIPVRERNFVSDITLKGNLEYHYSSQWLYKFGFEQKNLHVLFAQDFPGGEVDVDKRARHYVGYVQTNWRPSPHWDVEAGIRYNLFSSSKEFHDFEPRFSAKYRLSETINLKLATGLYHQYLHRVARTFQTDIWTTSNEFQDASTSRHLIAGIQKEIHSNIELEIEGFYKDYDNIYAFDETFLTEIQADRHNENGDPVFAESRDIFNQGSGESYGVELLLRKDVGTVTGWLGYSYSNTRYNFDDINGGKDYSPRHDRRSTINLVSNINLSRLLKGQSYRPGRTNWTFGANFVYSSGQPITPVGSAYLSWRAPGGSDPGISLYPAAINSYRLPAYARLDISLNYLRHFKNWSIEPYLQIYNAGNRKNVWFIDYDYRNGFSKIATESMFPILPTFGIHFNF